MEGVEVALMKRKEVVLAAGEESAQAEGEGEAPLGEVMVALVEGGEEALAEGAELVQGEGEIRGWGWAKSWPPFTTQSGKEKFY